MTTYTLHTPIPCHAAICKALNLAGQERRVTLGLDLELNTPAGALIVAGGQPLNLDKHPRSLWVELVGWLIKQGCEVHCVQEACGFGWEFHRELEGAGAGSMVVAPQELSGKRKTDKRDARMLASLLWDYVSRGNRACLRPVRVPSVEKQQQRGYHRRRSQLIKMRCQIAAQGCSLLWDHGWLKELKGWWTPKNWEQLKADLLAACRTWLVGMLEPMQRMCLQLNSDSDELKKKAISKFKTVKAGASEATQERTPTGEVRPKGLGELSYAIITSEVGDWNRFKNRGQPGSFIGCCPSEYSSGESQKMGQIDRMGSSRIRTTLVEAAWRICRLNPNWRGVRKYPEELGPEATVRGARKRKAIVACARMLMVDLWRLHVGTATLEGLGLEPATT
ncbi:IS110 family transposase [Verrucomicrobium sp. BvORR034]|uniref:IS110 family transposase n=2 Tax=unclassified Verrucomicrobium TaxID=2625155 RepID=UPI000678B5CE|nr:IS110 family transposase [Verrucomicrobium sp. BvORR034]